MWAMPPRQAVPNTSGWSAALQALSAILVLGSAAGECKWPTCVVYCEPCHHVHLHECEWSVLHVGQSCPASAECVLGECTCEQGYCPSNVSQHANQDFLLDGEIHRADAAHLGGVSFRSAGQKRCLPQVCHEGARPKKHDPTPWARILSGIIGCPVIPQDVIDHGVGRSATDLLTVLGNSKDAVFTILLMLWPTLLILAGITVAAQMLYSVACKTNVRIKAILSNHMRVTYSEGVIDGHVECFHMDDADEFPYVLLVKFDDVGGVSEDLESNFEDQLEIFYNERNLQEDLFTMDVQDAQSRDVRWPGKLSRDSSRWPMTCFFEPKHHDYVIKRPESGPMLALAGFTLTLAVVFAIMLAQLELDRTLLLLDNSMGEAQLDAVVAARHGRVIGKTASKVNASMHELHSECHWQNGSYVEQFDSEIMAAVDGYMRMISDIQSYLESAPTTIQSVHESFKNQKGLFIWTPLLPTVIVAILCAGMVGEAVFVRYRDRSAVAYDVDITLRLAAIFFAVGILAVTFIAAAELLVATFLSLFCMNVDENVLRLFNNNTAYNVTRHYVYGDVLNPITQNVQMTDKIIFHVMSAYASVPVALRNIGEVVISCPVTKFFNVSALAKDVRTFLKGVAPLFEPSNVYPYYDKVIREGMCNSLIDGVGWVLLSQLVVGMMCFPLCVYFAHKYLANCFIWQWAKENVETVGGTGARIATHRLQIKYQPTPDQPTPETYHCIPLGEARSVSKP